MNRYRNSFLTLGFGLCLFACEMKDNVKNSPGGPNPNYPSGPTQPEGSQGSTREALPANGAAVTGTGNTASDTSAASGAVNMQSNTSPKGKAGDLNRPDSMQPTYDAGASERPSSGIQPGVDNSTSTGAAGTGVSGSGSSSSDKRP